MRSSWMAYDFKTFLRTPEVLFWNILFPLVFLTVYFLATAPLADAGADSIGPIKLGVVQGAQEETVKRVADEIDKTNKGMIELKAYPTAEDAVRAAKNREVEVAVESLEPVVLKAAPGADSMDLYVVSSIFDMIGQVKAMTGKMTEGYASGEFPRPSDMKKTVDSYTNLGSDIGIKTNSDRTPVSPGYIFRFVLMAYLAFYPVNTGFYAVTDVEPNQSRSGLRKAVSPLSKAQRLFSNLLPVTLFQILLILASYGYAELLGINLGPRILEISALLVLGTLCAILTGTTLAAWIDPKHKWREVVVIACPLFFGFLAGLMAEPIRRMVIESLPWLNNINPISLVSNGLYALKADPGLARYTSIVVNLVVYFAGALALTAIGLRRTRYESI